MGHICFVECILYIKRPYQSDTSSCQTMPKHTHIIHLKSHKIIVVCRSFYFSYFILLCIVNAMIYCHAGVVFLTVGTYILFRHYCAQGPLIDEIVCGHGKMDIMFFFCALRMLRIFSEAYEGQYFRYLYVQCTYAYWKISITNAYTRSKSMELNNMRLILLGRSQSQY